MSTPISGPALLSDRRSDALGSRDGTIVRWPSPGSDPPSAFSSLPDAAGHWTIRPRGPARPRAGEPAPPRRKARIAHVGLLDAAVAITEARERQAVRT